MGNPLKNKEEEYSISRIGVTVAFLVLLVMTAIQGVVVINAGTRGVELYLGKPSRILGEGLNFKAPWLTSVEIMPVGVSALSLEKESTGTSEQLEVLTSITINYRLDPAYVDTIWVQLGRDYVNRVVKPFAQESLKQTTAKFTADAFLTQRDTLSNTFAQTLRDKLSQYHIELISVSINNYDFPDAYDAAIQAKLVEAQKRQEAQNILERIRIEAQQQVVQAEAAAQATKARANATAYETLVNAQAQAEAVRLINAQLAKSPEYVNYITALQWNGVLPVYYGGQLPIFLLPSNMTAKP